ncbi:ATP-binding protein [Umezawaea beigongshangensis]|uniref:ATP-binding protein n=1 Tax=Umezawaea beigongshangensis TaxID=2780383 RepID=UPI0018F138B1|nr:tetratricopeptide repeat protein [Umezawaea beigongshangensis]
MPSRDQDEQNVETRNENSGVADVVVQAGSITGDVHVHARPSDPRAGSPEQLPSTAFGFTDRDTHLAFLDDLLPDPDDTAAGSSRIAVICGTGGVGKSALATWWAHRVRHRFPDGQLYVNLRSYDPDREVSTGEALTGFLRSLQVPHPDIPGEVDERSARFRSLTAHRTMLVFVDNARTADQIRPLLPGSSSSFVVVTSRNAMPGLVSRDGARRVDLDLLPLPEAVKLLRTLIGDRVDAEPQHTAALAEHCARLPLALRVAAEIVASQTHSSIAELVNDLADEESRLDVLDTDDDPHTAIRTVFSWSYGYLSEATARTFRLLGLYSGRTFTGSTVAALADVDNARARQLLTTLTRVNLVERTRDSRYQMHDLLHAYASELANRDETEADRRAARGRLFDHFLSTAATAIDLLVPHEKVRRPDTRWQQQPLVTFHDEQQAASWMRAEQENLVASIRYAASHGWDEYARDLAAVLHRHLDSHADFEVAAEVHGHAVTCARRSGDAAGLSRASHDLGSTLQRLGRYRAAVTHLTEALTSAERAEDQNLRAQALNDLGLTHWLLGEYERAVDRISEALVVYRDVGDTTGQGSALNNLAVVHGRLGDLAQAVSFVEQSLSIFHRTGDVPRQGYALNDLAVFEARLDRFDDAMGHHRQALDMAGATGDRSLEAAALNGIGNTLRATGNPSSAVEHHELALAISERVSDRYEQAQAHRGIAEAREALGEPDEADAAWRSALTIYRELDAPEAVEVARRLEG